MILLPKIRIGVVGLEAAKFTSTTERAARKLIRRVIANASLVVSGKCHLGGIDIWAIEEAATMGISTHQFPALHHSWSNGYKPRNIQIAENSDKVVCITLRTLPGSYTGMRFKLCYHCKTAEHVKSGGCWTVNYARKLGKPGEVLVIDS